MGVGEGFAPLGGRGGGQVGEISNFQENWSEESRSVIGKQQSTGFVSRGAFGHA